MMASPDNTWKALKGEDLFVERWQCRVGWHRWTKWSEPVKGGVGSNYSTDYVQNRRCADCNELHSRKVTQS